MDITASNTPLLQTGDDILYESDIEDIINSPAAEPTLSAYNMGSDEEDDDDEDNNQDSILPLTVLTSGSVNPLTTATITYIALLPEYPRTSLDGYTFCVYIDPIRATPEMVLEDALQFQYCRKQKGPVKRTASPFLGGPAIRYRYSCTGVKRCEYLDNTLATMYHTRVTPETWGQMKSTRLNLYRSEPDIRKRRSTALYQAILHRYQNRTACVFVKPSCKPTLQQMKQQTVSGDNLWYIGCKSWTHWNKNEGHLFKVVGRSYDIEYLQDLFQDGLPAGREAEETCGTILTTRTKLRNCDNNHPQGSGKLIRMECDVQFDIVIPIDLQQYPYWTFTSHGIHTHPPPPPTRTPEALVQEIIALVRRANDPSMTTASFLRSPFLQEFCRSHRKPSFTQVHESLNNMDRLAQVIYREKLIMFPAGQELAGVEFEMGKRQSEPEEVYIREIVTNSLGTIILTLYKAQAEVFINLETFQVDLSFKRVAYGFHELIFAFYHEKHGKLFTLARIYINCEKRRIYQKSFELLFKHISQCTGKDVRWKHIHNNGFIGVTVDMDGKQMSGLGRYLSLVDPVHRDWQWQLRNTLKFCTAHFARSIITATSDIDTEINSVRYRMRALLTCQSWDDYKSLCEQLIQRESSTIGNWARHKLNPVIAAGLNRNITLMSQRDWGILEETSNYVEQAAKKSYSFGKGLHLLPAILAYSRGLARPEGVSNVFRAKILDQRDIDQWNSRIERDIRHSYRSTSMASRYSTNMARDKRKRKIPARGYDSDDDGDNAILFQASSSGYIRGRSRSKRQQSLPTEALGMQGELDRTDDSVSTSTTTPTSSQRVIPVLRSPSSQPSLQRQVLQQNLDAQAQRTALELREKEASIRKQELQNRLLELELLERERALGSK